MLRVDTRNLRQGPVRTEGEIPATDPLFEGLDLSLVGPLRVTGLLEPTARGGFLWHGQFGGQARSTCRRCLVDLVLSVDESVEALFTADTDLQDDPSVYPLAEPVTFVDVTGAVREELALALATFPLCREDCKGLCPTCGDDLNQGPCGCGGPVSR